MTSSVCDTVIRFGARCWLTNRWDESGQPRRDIGAWVRVVLVYDPADPYAIAMVIPKGGGLITTWTFGRELLNDGLVDHVDGPTGDVRVAPDLAGDVRIELSSPHGRAVLWLRALRVARFLNAAYRLVPAGTETDQIDWDSELLLLAGIGGEW